MQTRNKHCLKNFEGDIDIATVSFDDGRLYHSSISLQHDILTGNLIFRQNFDE